MKQYYRYRIDFNGKWAKWSAVFMGFSIFALSVYYFCLVNLQDFSVGYLVFRLWLPIILGTAYIIMMNLMKWNAPGVYGILGASMCVVLLIGDLFMGGLLRIILALLGYLICAGVLLLCVGGFLPGRLPAVFAFGIYFLLRLLLLDVGKLSLVSTIPELGILSMILALLALPMAMQPGKLHK